MIHVLRAHTIGTITYVCHYERCSVLNSKFSQHLHTWNRNTLPNGQSRRRAGTSEGAEGVVGPPEAIDDALVRAVVFLTVANGSEQAARSSRLPKVHVAHRFLHHSSFLDLCSSPAGSFSGHPNCFTHSSRASVTETVPSHVERTPRSGGDGRTGSSVPLLTWNTKRCA